MSLGGQQGLNASLGKILGPAFAQDEIPDVVEKILNCYLEKRHPEERFIDTYERIGLAPFKERVYA